MIRTAKWLVWVAALVLGLPHVAWSSCPASGTICAAYNRAALVFVAEVESVQPEAGPTRSGVLTQVRFRILERFKGTAGETLDMSLGPSSEEFAYAKGQRVLVYANRIGERRSTACSRTTLVSPSDSELLVLRAFHDKKDGGVIDGTVQTAERIRAGRMSNIRVVLRRDGALGQEIRTDSLGRFHTGWLTPGTYVLTEQAGRSETAKPREVVVSRASGCISIGSIANR